MPPSSRPRFLRPKDYKPPRSSATPDDLDDPEKKEKATSLPEPATASKKEKKRKTKEEKKLTGNNEGGKVRGEDGKVYDQSMIWALQETFRWDFWLCTFAYVLSWLLLVPLLTDLLPPQPPSSLFSLPCFRPPPLWSPRNFSTTSLSPTFIQRRPKLKEPLYLSPNRLGMVSGFPSLFSSCKRLPVCFVSDCCVSSFLSHTD